ncbi:MAG: HNH endonuclease [Vicinamibacterales bacterium]
MAGPWKRSQVVRARRVCHVPGCPAFEPCPAHGAANGRGTPAARGYDRRWREYSERFRRANPDCRLCGQQGRKVPCALVDHIEPVSGPSDPGFWDPANHQALCRPCHATKTKVEGRTQAPLADRAPVNHASRERQWRFA